MVKRFLFKTVLFILMPLSFIFLILIRLISPFLVIRIGMIPNVVVGDFIFDTQYYLSKKKINNKQYFLDFFYLQSNTSSNIAYERILKREIIIHRIFHFIDIINQKFFSSKIHTIKIRIGGASRDIKDYILNSQNTFYFNKFEENIGLNFLKELGIKPSDKFVCIINRDTFYKEKLSSFKKKDWSYHNHRNSSIKNYLKAASKLEEKGYFVLRMGFGVSEKIYLKSKKIIDYALSGKRTPLLDLYLFSKCYFALGRDGGINCVSFVNNRPCAIVNATNFDHAPINNKINLIIFKRFWDRKKNKYFKINEIFKNKFSNFYTYNDFEKNNIEVHENTEDEICELALEMHNRLNNISKYSYEDDILQNKFKEIFPKRIDNCIVRSRIGKKYIRDNLE